MSILAILLGLALIGVVLWLITTYIPMPAAYKQAMVVIVIVLVILWLVRVIGGSSVVVPRL